MRHPPGVIFPTGEAQLAWISATEVVVVGLARAPHTPPAANGRGDRGIRAWVNHGGAGLLTGPG
jgi:hypothetical protein